MSEQASRESFLVRGENVGLWLPLMLAVLGLIGAVITAQHLLSDWSAKIAQPAEPSEMEEGSIQGDLLVMGPESGGMPEISDQGDVPQAAFAPQVDVSVAADSSQIAEEISVASGSQEQPRTEAAEGEMQLGDDSSSSASDDQAAEVQPPGETPTSGQQVEPTPEPESPDASTIAQASDASPNAIASEPEATHKTASIEVTPYAAQDGTQPGATLSIGDASDAEEEVKEHLIDCAPLFSVGFNHGSIKPEDKGIGEEVTRLAHWLNEHPTAILYLDGHADPSGPADANLIISFRRAMAVSSLLSDAGAAKAQLIPRAYGEGTSSLPSSESGLQRRVILEINSGVPCDQPASIDGGP